MESDRPPAPPPAPATPKVPATKVLELSVVTFTLSAVMVKFDPITPEMEAVVAFSKALMAKEPTPAPAPAPEIATARA